MFLYIEPIIEKIEKGEELNEKEKGILINEFVTALRVLAKQNEDSTDLLSLIVKRVGQQDEIIRDMQEKINKVKARAFNEKTLDGGYWR